MRAGAFFRTLLLTATLAGCAGVPEKLPAAPWVLGLTPGDLGRPLLISRLVTGTFEERRWRAWVEIEASAGRLNVVVLTAFGVPILTLEQRGTSDPKITVLEAGTGTLDPRFMLFDLQITHWPVAPLARALAENDLTIAVDDDRTRRIITADGRMIAEVINPPAPFDARNGAGETHIRRYDIPYEIVLSPLPGRP